MIKYKKAVFGLVNDNRFNVMKLKDIGILSYASMQNSASHSWGHVA